MALVNDLDLAVDTSVLAVETEEGNYVGEIYVNSTVLYRFTAPVVNFPGGLEDFAHVTVRKYGRKLASLLGEEVEPLRDWNKD